MNNEQRRTTDDYEMENMHERRQRLRSERMRKWRKQTRHPRMSDFEDAAQLLLPRRFAS